MRRLLLGALAALALNHAVLAQNLVQGGASAIVPGHVATWIYNGILGNAQGAAGCSSLATCNEVTDFGITATGTPFCINDELTSGPYHQLCLGADSLGGGLITYNAEKGATADGLQIQINGADYPFPGAGNGNVSGPTAPYPLANDLPQWNGTTTLRDSGFLFTTPEDYGAVGDCTTNDGAAIQDAINAVETAAHGGIVHFGAKCYLFTPPLTITTGGVTLQCSGMFSTQLKETSGSNSDLIQIGWQTGQVQGDAVRDCGLIGNAPTGGYAIGSHNVANLLVKNIYLGNTWAGFDDDRTNNDLYDNVWGYTVGTNAQVFLWWTDSTYQAAGDRSDQLTINNFHVNAGFYGNTCFGWQGMANTLNMYNDTFLQCNYGFLVSSAQNTTTLFPQFAFIDDIQIEGAQTAGVWIGGGRKFYFVNSDVYDDYGETGAGGNQGKNDVAAFYVAPDKSASVTSDITWSGGEIGGSAKQAAILNAWGVKFSNMNFRGASLTTANAYPSVELEYTTSSNNGSGNYNFDNVNFCGIWGDSVQASYGLVRDLDVGQTQLTNPDFHWCQTGEMQDNTNGEFRSTGGLDRGGSPLPPSTNVFVGNGTPVASACGTSPSVSGNDIAGTITPGTGAPTSCTITYASSNSAANNGIGCASSVMLQQNSATPVYVSAASATGFTVASASALPSAIPYRVTQCYGN